ncbi:hypothetical protein N2152v2_004486 [Parachlorella kessleri]
MVFRRLPTYFPNFPLKLIPLTEAQQKVYEKTGFLRELAFRTIPSVNKAEIKSFLEKVYGLNVEKVNTVNVEGQKKRGKQGFFRRSDYKKAYVFLREAPAQPSRAR